MALIALKTTPSQDGSARRSFLAGIVVCSSTLVRGGTAGVALPYHFEPIMGDIGKPIRETDRPGPVRAPEPEPEPPPPPREPAPPPREPEPVEAQRA